MVSVFLATRLTWHGRRRTDRLPLMVVRWTKGHIDRSLQEICARIDDLQRFIAWPTQMPSAKVKDLEKSFVATLHDVFGPDDIRFKQHEHLQLWEGPRRIGLSEAQKIAGWKGGAQAAIETLKRLLSFVQTSRCTRHRTKLHSRKSGR